MGPILRTFCIKRRVNVGLGKKHAREKIPKAPLIKSVNIYAYEKLVDSIIETREENDRDFENVINNSGAEIDAQELSNAIKSQRDTSVLHSSIGAMTSKVQSNDLNELKDRQNKPNEIKHSTIETGNEYMNIDDHGDTITLDGYITKHNLANVMKEMNAEVGAIGGKPRGVSPEFISKIWHIRNNEAVGVINQTSQLRRRGATNALSKRYTTNDRMLRYKRISSMFFTDTFFVTASGKSTRGNTCAQLFVSDKGYVAIYPMKNKGKYYLALKKFCKDVGVPEKMVCDPSGEQTSKKVKQFCNEVGMTLHIIEESTQWANRAELYIGIFKEATHQDIKRANSPLCLWDYCAERRCMIYNVTPKEIF